MSGKIDLRVIKTKRAIKNAFIKQIGKKALNKIVVSDLVKDAEINKGTFYLHYNDIYHLYNEVLKEIVEKLVNQFNPYADFFEKPEQFVKVFLFGEVESLSKEESALLKEENIRYNQTYPAVFINAFKRKLYEVGKLVPSRENDIKLEFIITGMLSILIQKELLQGTAPSGDPFVISFVAGSIRQAFPEFYEDMDLS